MDDLETTPAPPVVPAAPGEGAMPAAAVESAIVEALRTVFDPEIPVNIYELGLIYDIALQEGGKVAIKMTLTAPGCPAAQELPQAVKERAESVAGVTGADVEVVWDPAWNPGMMSEAAKLQLGFL